VTAGSRAILNLFVAGLTRCTGADILRVFARQIREVE
jgi:hypothetical protein